MSNSDCQPKGQKKGCFVKAESRVYRKTCEGCDKGYHGHRWDAHHILPGVVFTWAQEGDEDSVIVDCLNVTDYDINKAYSMAGLPRLTAHILHYQTILPAYQEKKEKQVTMRRWGTVKPYRSQAHLKSPTDPGNFPAHNPCNWGHTRYNKEVLRMLDGRIFDELRRKKKDREHFTPKDLKEQIAAVKDDCWKLLEARAHQEGIPTKKGIKANLMARYDEDNHGWWKPLCMTDVEEPASPSLG